MKARLPQGFGNPKNSIQELAKQAQELQAKMDQANRELEEKEYSATVGGNAVTVTVTGKMEVKKMEIKPEAMSARNVAANHRALTMILDHISPCTDTGRVNMM